MPTVSAGDLTLLRGHGHRSDVYTSFLVPPILWQARINDGSIVKGETTITFDQGTGSFFSLVEALQDLWVGYSAGEDDVGGPGNGRLRIRSISSGDGGVTGTVTVGGHSLPLQDDLYLTFKHDYPLRPRWSYIDPATEIWYIDDDVTYVDQHEEPPPVVIAGPHRGGFLDSGSFAINVDASGSYAIANGASISSYGLTVASTAGSPTVNFNSGTGLGDITFTAPGYYWARYTATDSNGKSQISYRCYIVHDRSPTGFYPYTHAQNITLTGDWEAGGWIAGIESKAGHSLAEIPNHTLCIIWREAWYGSTQKNITFLPDSSSTIFAGYVRGEVEEMDMAIGMENVDLIASTIDGRLARIYSFSASMVAQQSGVDHWGEIPNWHTVGTLVHALLRWRCTIFELTDVIGLRDNSWRRMGYEPDDNNLYDMVNQFSMNEGIRAKLVCDQGGRMHFAHDMQLMIASERSALTTAFELKKDPDAADYGGSLIIPRAPEPEAPFVESNGIYWDGTTWDSEGRPKPTGDWCVISPGGKPLHEGPSPKDYPKQTIPSLAYLEELAGRFLAKDNNPIESIRLDFAGDYLGVLDIAYDDSTYDISLASGDTPRGQVFTNHPLYCRNVSARFRGNEGTWKVEAEFEAEAEGITGVETQCPGFPPLGGIVPAIPLPTAVPGALMTGASVHFKPASGNAWTKRISQDVKALVEDPFWRIRQSSVSPNNAIVFRCGLGYIKRTTDGFISTDVDVTPSTNPPNPAGDSPAPTNTTVTYHAIEGSFITQSKFAALARWQNVSGVWRSWIVYTTNDGTSWTWAYLGSTGCPSCINPSMDFTANPDGPVTYSGTVPYSNTQRIVEIDTGKYAWIYDEDNDSNIYVQCFSVSGGSVTFGDRYNLAPQEPGGWTRLFQIDSTHFGAMYMVDAQFNPPFYTPFVMAVNIITISGLTVTGDSEHLIMTWDETIEHGNSGETQTTDHMGVWSDGTYVYVISALDMLSGNGSCNEDGYPSLSVLRGTLSGGSLTWDTTTCGGSDINDWQKVLDAENNYGVYSVRSSSTHGISVYGSTDGYFYAICNTGLTFGSAVALPSSNLGIYGSDLHQGHLLRLTDTLAVFVIWNFQGASGYEEIEAWAISRSGTTLSVGAMFQVYADADTTSIHPFALNVVRVSNTQFFVTIDGQENPDCNCDGGYLLSVFGTTISKDAYCYYWIDSDAVPLLAPVVESSTEVAGIGANYAGTQQNGGVVLDITNLETVLDNCPGGVVEARSLGLSIGKLADTYAWATIADGTNLELVRVTLSTMALTRYSLGSASQIDVDNKAYIAYPYVPIGYDSVVYLYGRMNNPQSLGDPAHIIRTDDGGSSFNLIENSWGSSHCGALIIGIDGRTYAIRNLFGQSKLYRDSGDSILLLRVTLPWPGRVAPKGMWVSRLNTDVFVVAWVTDSKMVAQISSPHLLAKDITFDHEVTEPIEAIIQL